MRLLVINDLRKQILTAFIFFTASEFYCSSRHEVAFGTAWLEFPDQALRVAAGIPRKHALDGLPRKRSGLLSEVWSLPGNVSNLVASNRERARIGGHGQN